MRFDHLGVVVGDLASGRRLLGESIGVGRWTAAFEDPVQDVFVQFGHCASAICYEIIAPRSPTSPVARALAAKINVINHIAYLVADLAGEATRLGAAGVVPIGPAKPAAAYDLRPVQFFISPARFMLELIEAPGHRHVFNTGADA